MRDCLGQFSPVLVLCFFIAAITACVIVNNPIFLLVELFCSASYYLSLRGRKGWKTFLWLVPLFLVVTVINPVFSTFGDTVLFYWFEDRPYTLEALAYGSSIASMLVSVLLWFFSFNVVMTSDKLLNMFGKFAPSISLVITMVLRFVPTYQRKALEISSSRAGIGLSPGGKSRYLDKAKSGISALSALVSWALEGAIVTADSMRSRGYGLHRRASYLKYSYSARDMVLSLLLAVLYFAFIWCVVHGAGEIEYYPQVFLEMSSAEDLVGLASLFLFMIIPTGMNLMEAFAWRISLSKI